jgi:hypothetical protein
VLFANSRELELLDQEIKRLRVAGDAENLRVSRDRRAKCYRRVVDSNHNPSMNIRCCAW